MKLDITTSFRSKLDIYQFDFYYKLTCALFQVTIGPDGSCAQNGMLAISDIKEGECLFRISRKILLHPKTSSLSALLEKGSIR